MATCERCGTEVGALVACPGCGSPQAQGPMREAVFEASGGDASLELDVVLPPKSGAPPPVARPVSVSPAGPSLASQPPAAPKVDLAKARTIAKYGLPPEHFWEAPGYAFAVKKRKKELEPLVASHREQFEKADAAYQAELDRLALRAAAACESFTKNARAPYARTIDKLKETEKVLSSFDSEHAAEAEAYKQRREAADKQVAELQKELDAATAAQKAAGTEAPPSFKKRVDDARVKVTAAAKARDEIDDAFDKAGARAYGPAAKKARKEFQRVTKAFALFVVDDTANFGKEFDAARQAIWRTQRLAGEAQTELELHEAALAAFDADAVQAGKNVVVGTVILGVIALAIVARAVL